MPNKSVPYKYTAQIGLGSNLGDRREFLRSAVLGLRQVGDITAVSHLWQTAPVGLNAWETSDQPPFLNAAVTLETTLEPLPLLEELLRIEREHGRDRSQQPPKAPRTLDLDLLLVESASGPVVLQSEALTLPHPALHERRFVLAPLSEIAPTLVHPVLHLTIAELLDKLKPEGPNHPDAVASVGTLQDE